MIDTVQQLLRTRLADDSVAVAHGDRSWTWREHLAEAAAEASALIGLADPERPTAEQLRAMSPARLAILPLGWPGRRWMGSSRSRLP